MKKEEKLQKNTQSILQSDKIDVEELFRDLRLQKSESFSRYLREVFRVPFDSHRT